MKNQWSEPQMNNIRYGHVDAIRRASIDVYENAALLTIWWRGCGFNPENKWFDTLEEAKAAGETWTDRGESWMDQH